MVTLYPTKDSWVGDNNPDETHGSDDGIYGGIDSGNIRNGLTEFYIGDISSSSAITSATLRLYFATGNSGTETLYANRITDDSWTEADVTYNTKPSHTTTNQASLSISDDFSSWKEWTVTDLVKDARDAGTVCGIYVMNDSGTYYKGFHSKDKVSGNSPELVIVHTDATRYVDISTGSDSDDGLTWANAYLTVKKGIDNVPSGYIIHIAEGDYSAQAAIDLDKDLEVLCEDYGGGNANPPLTVVLPVTT